MDAGRFDRLTRSLTAGSSRRGVMGALFGGTLGLLGLAESEARRKKKHKKKRKKRSSCTPECPGTTCGADGCGGSCGSCVGGSCTGGICACPGGEDPCGGTCLTACAPDDVRNPITCQCCTRIGQECDGSGDCCSDICDPNALNRCKGRDRGTSCQFDKQCASGLCSNDVCTCPSGTDVCKNTCLSPCQEGSVRNLVDCHCCIGNGVSCSDPYNTEFCCAGPGTCTGPGLTCVGREDGAVCQDNVQCATSDCLAGYCDGPPGG